MPSELRVDKVSSTTSPYTPVFSTTGGALSHRNRIINGDMRIDQRNSGASLTPVDGSYTVDRWHYFQSQTGKFTCQQNQGSVTPPAGFTQYLGFTSSSSYSIASGDYFVFQHSIEGFNVADLGWGTANAKNVTLSFWIRSSVTGTFSGSFKNLSTNANRSYPFNYTISSANTWEHKTITIAGDTSGTWATNNTTGLCVCFDLGTGTTYSGTAGAWAGQNYLAATGSANIVATSGATLQITGVQLERGTVATPFEYRSYGEELLRCQRYFWKRYADSSGEDDLIVPVPYNASTTNSWATVPYPVQMRAKPTLQNANWAQGTPGIINEGLYWVALNFSNDANYIDKNTYFELDAELS